MALCMRTLKIGVQPAKLALRSRCVGNGLEQAKEQVTGFSFMFDESDDADDKYKGVGGLARRRCGIVGLTNNNCNVNDEIIALHGKRGNMIWAEDDLQRDVIVRQNYYPVMLVLSQDWHRNSAPLTLFEKTMILSKDPPSSSSSSTNFGKVPEEKLVMAFNNLSHWLPQIFTKVQDYRIYSDDIIFQNNIRGVTTHGLAAYVRQMSMLRLIGHLRFAFVKLEILKITKHPEDGTVRVRWRIMGVSGLRFIFKLWQVKNWQNMMNAESSWYDGFSTFYVGADGKIFKHICDKMMPDEEKEAVNANRTTNLAAKLALLLGVIPRPSLEDLNSIICAFARLQDPSTPDGHHHHVD